MKDYSDYRIGSPVQKDGHVTAIKGVPINEKDTIGYEVVGSADGIQEKDLIPIPLSPKILMHIGFSYDDCYWQLDTGKHHVKFDLEDGCIIVDHEPLGTIHHLHELKNVLQDKCDDYSIRSFCGTPVESLN